MSSQRRLRALVWLALAVVALLLLAAGITSIALQSGEPLPLGALLALLLPPGLGGGGGVRSEPLAAWVAWVFWALTLCALAGFFFSPTLRKRVLRSLPFYLATALMLYALVRVLRGNVGQPANGGTSGEPRRPPDLDVSLPALPQFTADPPRWLLLLLGVLVVALALTLAWLVLRRRAQKQPNDSLADLAQEARHALDALDEGGDVRATVLRCYGEMTRVLRRQRGVQRPEATTPREFEQLLASTGLRDEHIRQLTRLFERVRYGGAAASERDEEEARACLTAIVQAYSQPA